MSLAYLPSAAEAVHHILLSETQVLLGMLGIPAAIYPAATKGPFWRGRGLFVLLLVPSLGGIVLVLLATGCCMGP